MASFKDLPDDRRGPRSFGIAGEAELVAAPISALLRARQAIQSWLDDRRIDEPVEAFGFRKEWQNILLGRKGVCPAMERQAAFKATKFAFRYLRMGTSLSDWALPEPVGTVDTFPSLQIELDVLDERVSSGAAPSPPELLQALEDLDRRIDILASGKRVSDAEYDMLSLGRALIALGAANHRGAVYKPPGGDLELLLQRASMASGHVQRLCAEYRNREGIALTNCFRFEEACRVFEGLVEQLRVGTITGLKDEVLGAALGSAGQATGFRARTLRDAALARTAILYFDQAAPCFTLPGDLERQATYRVHALCEGVLLGDQALRPLLLDAIGDTAHLTQRIDRWRTGSDDGPRVDYPLAVWLKAHHTLGRGVPKHPALITRWLEYADRVYPKGDASHGSVLVAGWLAVTAPTNNLPPAVILPLRSAADAAHPSILAFIARTFLLQLCWRGGPSASLDFSSAVAVAEGAPDWWRTEGLEAWARTQCEPGGYGPLAALPFNFV